MSLFMSTRDQNYFQEKLQSEMERRGVSALLLTQPESVFYATGYMGCMNYRFRRCGNCVAVVPAHGPVELIISQFEHGGALEQTRGSVKIRTFPVWIYVEDFDDGAETRKETQPDPLKTFKLAVDALKELGVCGKVGVERSDIPYDKYRYLVEAVGEDNLVECASLLTACKMIKNQWEIDICRYSAEVAQKVMEGVMKYTQEGMSECDLVGKFTSLAYEITGGHELCKVNNVHTVGPNYWATYIPREYKQKKGDIVRLDGGVQVYGYLSDLARTYAVGEEVADDKKAIFDALLAGYDRGMAMAGPGVKLSELFNEVLAVIRGRGYDTYIRGHFGHTTGSGLTEDYPFIAPDSTETMKPGMVFCLETPFYGSIHHSYNIEDEFLVTENGIELFTHTNRSLLVSQMGL